MEIQEREKPLTESSIVSCDKEQERVSTAIGVSLHTLKEKCSTRVAVFNSQNFFHNSEQVT
jgi:DNA-binding protein Fis